MKKHDLRKHTKEELIWLIENVGGFGLERRIGEVLIELDYKRAMKKLDEADSHAKKAHAARERYIEIMKPYEGRRISDIPIGVLDKGLGRPLSKRNGRKDYTIDRKERLERRNIEVGVEIDWGQPIDLAQPKEPIRTTRATKEDHNEGKAV